MSPSISSTMAGSGGSWNVSGRMPIGIAATCVMRPRCETTSSETFAGKSDDAQERKFATCAGVWKPSKSKSSIASRICAAQGSIENMSSDGKGMWRKCPIGPYVPAPPHDVQRA